MRLQISALLAKKPFFNKEIYFLSRYLFADCVQVIANPGTYVVHSREGSNDPCGVYIAGLHNELIEVEISLVDVSCQTNGLVAVSIYISSLVSNLD